MQSITEHEEKINSFEQIMKEKEEQIKKLRKSNESLDSIHLSLI